MWIDFKTHWFNWWSPCRGLFGRFVVFFEWFCWDVWKAFGWWIVSEKKRIIKRLKKLNNLFSPNFFSQSYPSDTKTKPISKINYKQTKNLIIITYTLPSLFSLFICVVVAVTQNHILYGFLKLNDFKEVIDVINALNKN